VPRALVLRRAPGGVGGRNLDHVLIDMSTMHVMQMPVVEVIDVTRMPDSGMPAARPVDVIVVGMLGFGAACHALFLTCSVPHAGTLHRAMGRVQFWIASRR